MLYNTVYHMCPVLPTLSDGNAGQHSPQWVLCMCVSVVFPPLACQRAPFAPKNDPEQNHWSFRDVEAMAQRVGTEPILLDADASKG